MPMTQETVPAGSREYLLAEVSKRVNHARADPAPGVTPSVALAAPGTVPAAGDYKPATWEGWDVLFLVGPGSALGAQAQGPRDVWVRILGDDDEGEDVRLNAGRIAFGP